MKYRFVWRHQPLKTLYLASALVKLGLQLPIWAILALVPAFRPRRTWTYRRTLLIKVCRLLVQTGFNACMFRLMRVDPRLYAGREEEAGLVWVDPVPGLVVGEIERYARLNGVAATRVPAYWFGERDTKTPSVGQPARSGEKVILYYHPGGWIVGDASPVGISADLCRDVLSRYPQFSRLLSIEYRLSQGPPLPTENAFPSALIDGITAYNYLVNTLGFEPNNILVMGESAGGTTALQLVRYIVSANLPALPPPRGLCVMSPVMDWGHSHTYPGSSMDRNQATDWIAGFTSGYCVNAVLGNLPPTDVSQNSWISPASHDLPVKQGLFKGLPPTLILAGAAETTYDAMETGRNRLRGDGVDVEFVAVPDATHVFLCLPFHEREKEKAYEMMGDWFKTHFNNS